MDTLWFCFYDVLVFWVDTGIPVKKNRISHSSGVYGKSNIKVVASGESFPAVHPDLDDERTRLSPHELLHI